MGSACSSQADIARHVGRHSVPYKHPHHNSATVSSQTSPTTATNKCSEALIRGLRNQDVNGKEQRGDVEEDAAPLVKEQEEGLPLAALFEIVGHQHDHDAATKSNHVVVKDDDQDRSPHRSSSSCWWDMASLTPATPLRDQTKKSSTSNASIIYGAAATALPHIHHPVARKPAAGVSCQRGWPLTIDVLSCHEDGPPHKTPSSTTNQAFVQLNHRHANSGVDVDALQPSPLIDCRPMPAQRSVAGVPRNHTVTHNDDHHNGLKQDECDPPLLFVTNYEEHVDVLGGKTAKINLPSFGNENRVSREQNLLDDDVSLTPSCSISETLHDLHGMLQRCEVPSNRMVHCDQQHHHLLVPTSLALPTSTLSKYMSPSGSMVDVSSTLDKEMHKEMAKLPTIQHNTHHHQPEPCNDSCSDVGGTPVDDDMRQLLPYFGSPQQQSGHHKRHASIENQQHQNVVDKTLVKIDGLNFSLKQYHHQYAQDGCLVDQLGGTPSVSCTPVDSTHTPSTQHRQLVNVIDPHTVCCDSAAGEPSSTTSGADVSWRMQLSHYHPLRSTKLPRASPTNKKNSK